MRAGPNANPDVCLTGMPDAEDAPMRKPSAILACLITELSVAAKQPRFQKRLPRFDEIHGQQLSLEDALKQFQTAELARKGVTS